MTRGMKYQQVFQDGVAKGYSVTYARQYETPTGSDVEVRMQTPFVNGKGQPITGYAVTPLTHTKGDVLRESNTVELYDGSQNMDYQDLGYHNLYDKAGNPVDLEKARQEMSQFASAASEYPHVMMYEEWLSSAKKNYERLQLGEPDESGYECYLESEHKKLMSKDFTYVGEITSVRDLHGAYQSMPSVQQAMDEVYQTSEPEFE